MVKYSIDIEKKILSYLDGWSIGNPEDIEEGEEIDNLFIENNKIVSLQELEEFFNKACKKISTYLYVEDIPSDDRIIEEVCQYTAGLIFKKYTLTPNNDFEDGTNNVGYGNYLMNNALNNLIPFRNSTISMWSLRI